MRTKAEIDRDLVSYFERLGESVVDYDTLQGILFGVVCSPEVLKPSEWFEWVWLDEEAQFDELSQAQEFFKLLLELYECIEASVDEGRWLTVNNPKNIDEQEQFARWCEGLLFVHQCLEDVWDQALRLLNSEEADAAVTMALSLSCVFIEVPHVERVQGVDIRSDEPCDITINEAYEWFDQALATYAEIRYQWQEQEHDEISLQQQRFIAMEPLAATDLCRCGSGKPFAKCCLH